MCVCMSGIQAIVENKVIKEPRVTAYLATLETRDQWVSSTSKTLMLFDDLVQIRCFLGIFVAFN